MRGAAVAAVSAAVLMAGCAGEGSVGEGSVGDARPPSSEPAVEVAVPGPGYPRQPDGVAWPTDEWPVGTPDDAVDQAAVDALVDEALHGVDGAYGDIEAVLVVDGGRLVLEEYGRGFGPDQVHPSYSIAKTVTHAATGILSGDGRLDIEEPAPVEAWSGPGDPRAAITVDMLLRMTSGLEWDESDWQRPVGATAAAAQIEAPLAAEPDTVWNYSTGSTAVVGQVLGDLVGTGDDFDRWMADRLFDPVGIASVELSYDDAGYFVAGTGADMTARDFARLGLLYQRDGVWDGQRILPEGWVDYGRAPSGPNDSYGAGLWTEYYSPDGFSAEGTLGQNVIMVPDADLVVVVLSNNRDGTLTDDFSLELIEAFRAADG